MICQYCNNSIPAGSTTCPHCGAPAPAQPSVPAQPSAPAQSPAPVQPAAPTGQQQTENPQQTNSQEISTKKRSVFIVLGVFLGSLGIHNFYAGFVGRGIVQLLLMVFSEGYAYPILLVWNIIEFIFVMKDARGRPFIRS